MRSSVQRFYEFGDFRLYPHKRLLVRQDKPVGLRPKVLDILRLLVANNDRVVSKEELLNEVWAGIIVEESGLTRNISVLRKALGTDIDGHGYIATVPGRGYQFVGDVRQATSALSTRSQQRVVGREKEVDALTNAFQKVLAGSGMLVCVAGEPGIGKTTLVEKFLRKIADDESEVRIARARCSENLTGSGATLPWLEALDNFCRQDGGYTEDSGSSASLVKKLAPSWYQQLSTLTSHDPDFTPDSAPRTATRDQLKLELGALFYEVTRRQPLVLFFDDLHWSDDSTGDMLGFLVSRFPTLPLFIVATYRPADLQLAQHPLHLLKSNWQAHGLCHEILLGSLDSGEIDEYLALEFPKHDLPPGLTTLIHRRTEGNPLFMTELVRDLKTRGIIALQDGCWRLIESQVNLEWSLPESVRGLIEAKIAQLDPLERRLLQVASVQGYDFDSAVVGQVLEQGATGVEESLATLDRVKRFVSLVDKREMPDGTVSLRYRFAHVLYQEALYGQIGPSRLVEVSAGVAAAILRYWAQRSNELASQLAELFETARDWSASTDFFLLSARHAIRFSAHRDGVFLARRGLATLSRLPQTTSRDEQELELQVILGTSLIVVGNWDARETQTAFTRAHELAERVPLDANALGAEWGYIVCQYVRGRFADARRLSERILSTCEGERDLVRLLVGHSTMGIVLALLGEPQASKEHLVRAIEIYDPEQLSAHTALRGVAFGVSCRCYLARSLWLLGWPDQSRRCIEEALESMRRSSPGGLTAHTLLLSCTVHQFLRDTAACREFAETVITRSQSQEPRLDSDGPGWAPVALGWALVQEGQVTEGLNLMRPCLRSYRQQGRGWIAQGVMFAEALLIAKRIDEAIQTLDDLDQLIESTSERFYDAERYRIRGEASLLLAAREDRSTSHWADRMAEAESCFARSLEVARKQNARSLELRTAMSLARRWNQTGKRAEAHQMLTSVYSWFTEGFETPDLREAKALISDLS